jgi:hypothetical protein
MCSIANFSSELLRKDISKMSLGFIAGLDGITDDLLIKHLCQKGKKFSKSSAEVSIRKFKLIIEREFWKLIFASLKRYEESGVKMYILGQQRLVTVFIRFAFVVGDDPALHRFCGVKEGNSLRSCIRCLYSAKKDGLYNENECRIRQAEELEYYTALGEMLENRKKEGVILSDRENSILQKLKNQCIHPIALGCNQVPMGFIEEGIKNNVYRSSPCDILHGFLAGIIRNVIIWTMNIIHNLSRINKSHVRGLLDARVATFMYWPKMPNMVNTYFRKGCSFINKSKKLSEMKRSTAGVPGLRSLEFISLLLQMYLSVSN